MTDTRIPTEKFTDMPEIHAEEIQFLGEEIPFNIGILPKHNISGYESIEVRLVSPTLAADDVAYDGWVRAAAKTALATWMSEGGGVESIDELCSTREKAEAALLNILKERPISAVLESFAFVFEIRGLPRAITHQIVRHRAMSFGQQSLRVSSCYGDTVRAPQAVLDEVENLEVLIGMAEENGEGDHPKTEKMRENLDMHESYLMRYTKAVSECREVYRIGVELGYPVEQVRNIMPMGTTTKVYATLRLREVIQYMRDRTQAITQGEHHYLVCLFANALSRDAPNFWRLVSEIVPSANDLLTLPTERTQIERLNQYDRDMNE